MARQHHEARWSEVAADEWLVECPDCMFKREATTSVEAVAIVGSHRLATSGLLFVLGGPDGHTPVMPELIEEIEDAGARRMVGMTEVRFATGALSITVSTVFLTIQHPDHTWFETMRYTYEPHMINGRMFARTFDDEYQERYHTWEEAALGHEVAVMLVSAGHEGQEVQRHDIVLRGTLLDEDAFG